MGWLRCSCSARSPRPTACARTIAPAWAGAVHADLAKLSTRSRHAVIVPAGHETHLFDPPAVVGTIREVLGQLARP